MSLLKIEASIMKQAEYYMYFFACIAVHFKGVTMMHFPRNIYENGSFCKDQGLVKTYGLSKVQDLHILPHDFLSGFLTKVRSF